jgi:hypothetical protein
MGSVFLPQTYDRTAEGAGGGTVIAPAFRDKLNLRRGVYAQFGLCSERPLATREAMGVGLGVLRDFCFGI